MRFKSERVNAVCRILTLSGFTVAKSEWRTNGCAGSLSKELHKVRIAIDAPGLALRQDKIAR